MATWCDRSGWCRHPNRTTRVVLDVAGISSYSVYPLYSPYRLVIDCIRETPEPLEGAAGRAPRRSHAPVASVGLARQEPGSRLGPRDPDARPRNGFNAA